MRIGMDLDGVLVDAVPYWVELFNRELGTNFSPGDLPETYGTPEMAACSEKHQLHMLIAPPPIVGAAAAVRHLQSVGHQLTVITARTPRVQGLTEAWFDYYGFDLRGGYYLEGGSKVGAALETGIDLMIEDAPNNALALADAGVQVLLFRAPYNERVEHENILRLVGWDAVLAEVERRANVVRLRGA